MPQKVRSRKLRSDGGLRMPCLCRQMHGHAGNTWHHPPDRATPAAAPTSVASWLGTPGAVLVGDRLAASRRRGCSHPGAYHHRVTRCCAGGAAGPPCERRPCVRLGVLSAAHHWQLYPHRTVYIWTTPGSGRTDGISRTPLGPSGPRRRDCWLQGRGGGGGGGLAAMPRVAIQRQCLRMVPTPLCPCHPGDQDWQEQQLRICMWGPTRRRGRLSHQQRLMPPNLPNLPNQP